MPISTFLGPKLFVQRLPGALRAGHCPGREAGHARGAAPLLSVSLTKCSSHSKKEDQDLEETEKTF